MFMDDTANRVAQLRAECPLRLESHQILSASAAPFGLADQKTIFTGSIRQSPHGRCKNRLVCPLRAA
jgi:hypothetical protein